MADSGIDLLVTQGHEAGGHTGRIGTMALVPPCIDAVYPVLVLAAGGIADGRGLAAALAMGCVGIWVGISSHYRGRRPGRHQTTHRRGPG